MRRRAASTKDQDNLERLLANEIFLKVQQGWMSREYRLGSSHSFEVRGAHSSPDRELVRDARRMADDFIRLLTQGDERLGIGMYVVLLPWDYYHAVEVMVSEEEWNDWEMALFAEVRRLWVLNKNSKGRYMVRNKDVPPAAPHVGVKLVQHLMTAKLVIPVDENGKKQYLSDLGEPDERAKDTPEERIVRAILAAKG